ncbi:thiamine phosphate synthase [Maricaulis sp.]|uniref:thiamine phosphate synthase n=1 Tax=Maricaulis sp. TaxID=1486257 RepID=UPI002B269A42|nr:thiamine phosphate synthase [Maricaulis sp.]
MKPPYDAATRLASAALSVRGDLPCALPPLLVLTDPKRLPDPVALAGALPPGSGLVYRHFGHHDRQAIACAAVAIARERGVTVLVSSDLDLAMGSGAAGVHWPERMIGEAGRARARGCRLLFSAAAHAPSTLSRADRAGLDAVLVSTVFASQSPTARRAMGPMALSAWVRRTALPVYALGGINHMNALRLSGLGISGVAVVSAIRSAGPTQT